MIKIYLIYIQYIAYTGLDQGGTMDTESKTYDEAEFQRLYDHKFKSSLRKARVQP